MKHLDERERAQIRRDFELRKKNGQARVGDWGMPDIQGFYSLAKDHPRETYDFCYVKEIREACFRRIYDWVVDNDELAVWAEEKIKELLLISNEGLMGKMLNWYVFFSSGDEREAKSINFAISLFDLVDEVELPGRVESLKKIVSKILVWRLRVPDHNLYRQLTRLPKFLGRMLNEVRPPFHRVGDNSDSKVYYDEEWFLVERALRIIVAQKDFSFLPKIGDLITLLQEGKIKPQDKLFYASESHLAVLKKASNILLEAQKESLAGEVEAK